LLHLVCASLSGRSPQQLKQTGYDEKQKEKQIFEVDGKHLPI
jgi:hypothetical protein